MTAIGVKVNAPIVAVRWQDIRDMARVADDGGLESVWSEDHHFGPRDGGDPWDLWSVLAALAASTERVRLGSIVALLNFVSPLLFARKAAAVQEISGGRLVLGVGAGSLPAEYPKAGLEFDRPISRFAEAFEVVRRLLAGERFTYVGDHWSLDDTWLSTPPEVQPEVMLGSCGPRMLSLVPPHARGRNVHWGDDEFWNSPARFRELNGRIDAACEEHDRDPSSVWRSAEVYVQFEGAHGLPISLPDDFPVYRGVDEVAALLADMGAAGADLVQVLVDPQTPRSVEQLAAIAKDLA